MSVERWTLDVGRSARNAPLALNVQRSTSNAQRSSGSDLATACLPWIIRPPMQSPSIETIEPRDAPAPGARSALVLLLSINLFNYIDRFILAAVEPKISAELFGAGDPRALAKM